MRWNGAHPRPAQPGCAGVSPAYSDVTNHGSAGSVPPAVLRRQNTHAPGHQCRFAFVVHPQVLRQRDDRTLWRPPRAEHPRSGASMSVCVCRSSSGPARAERPRSMASHTSRTPTLRGIPHEQNAHAPGRKEESTFLTPHFSPLTPHPSLLTPHSSLLTPRFSPLTPHSSPLTPHSSLLTPHSSLLTSHSSLLTPHSSPRTRPPHRRCRVNTKTQAIRNDKRRFRRVRRRDPQRRMIAAHSYVAPTVH